MTFKAVCFLKGRRVGGGMGVLCLCLSLYFEKKTLRKMSVTEIQSCGF